MSLAAVMLVKDEIDVIDPVLAHLRSQVDAICVADNGSTDGTREYLDQAFTAGDITYLSFDPDPAYYQSRKTTELAMRMLEDGHDWVLPCDADEIWVAGDGRPIRDWIAGLAGDVQLVSALLYHHIPTALDDHEDHDLNPFTRIRWRKRHHAGLPKILARLRPDLVIEAGNHSARTSGTGVTAAGLEIRHFSHRSEDQYLRKIRNGERAYAATDLPEEIGAHWRMWADQSDEAIRDHFRCWFFSPNPRADDTLMLDPAPWQG